MAQHIIPYFEAVRQGFSGWGRIRILQQGGQERCTGHRIHRPTSHLSLASFSQFEDFELAGHSCGLTASSHLTWLLFISTLLLLQSIRGRNQTTGVLVPQQSPPDPGIATGISSWADWIRICVRRSPISSFLITLFTRNHCYPSS